MQIKTLRHKIESYLPRILRQFCKCLYFKIVRYYHKCFHLKKGKLTEIGYRFRFSRTKPHVGFIGDRTIIEEFNVWNAKAGNITVGKECWFGLHNIFMGPLEVGDRVSTGPYVSILGPRHAKFDIDERKKQKTIIGNDVWISTGSIISFGIKIGNNATIAPGSVVTKNIPDNAYVIGNPARDITKLAATIWEENE